jgi:hypothetical protein
VTPEWIWKDLEALVPPRTSRDSALDAALRFRREREDEQPRIPLTIRLDTRGGVRADTTLVVRQRKLRVVLERVSSPAILSPF